MKQDGLAAENPVPLVNPVKKSACRALTRVSDVAALIEEKQPDVLALSVSVAYSLDTLLSTAAEIRAAFPEVPVLVGGQAFRWVGRERVEALDGVRCLTDLGELEAWIKEADAHV